jgi:plastocyanin
MVITTAGGDCAALLLQSLASMSPLTSLLLILRFAAASNQSATNGAIEGRITAASGTLPEMIIYLDHASPDQAVPHPGESNIVVSQKGAKFGPSMLVIAAGQTVEFRNDEDKPIEHNVFSRSPAKTFDLGLYPPNTGGKTVTFDKPGVVRLYCSIHRYMDGVVYVCPTPLFAKVGEGGAFRIENVPAGQWKLRTWQRGARYAEQDTVVSVDTGKTAQVNLEMKR